MSGLKLGDLTLDPRRAVYVSSLRALVCSGVIAGLQSSISEGLRGVVERVDGLYNDYSPQTLVLLEPEARAKPALFEAAASLLSRRWGRTSQIHVVGSGIQGEPLAIAEARGFEIHSELVWGRYRFVGIDDATLPEIIELQLMTFAASPNCVVRVGNSPFGGLRLQTFVKGVGRLLIPSSDPLVAGQSVLRKSLAATMKRDDLFAIGHQRVLPLGKVDGIRQLSPFKGIARGLPISRATLDARRKVQKAPSAD